MNSWHAEFGGAFQGRRVLVTGATGFIGWHLGQALVALGAEIVGVARSASVASVPDGVQPLAIDLSQKNQVATALEHTRFDIIFHLAGHVSAQQDRHLVMPMLEANLLTTVHLLLAAADRGWGRFILAGSAEEPSLDEALVPLSPYAAAKLAAMAYGCMFYRLYSVPVVGLRLFLTYGPRQEPSKLVPYTILSLVRNESPSLTSGSQVCDAIYVTDAVRGMLKAALAPSSVEGQLFDLGMGTGITVRQLVETMAQLIPSRGRPVFGSLQDRSGNVHRVADMTRTCALLGWAPRWSLHEGLQQTIAWYSEKLRLGVLPWPSG